MPDVIPISRNAPCPCGSGLKHKRCCGRDAPAQCSGASPWHRLRNAEGVFVSALSDWTDRCYGTDLLADAWAEFGATDDPDAPPHEHRDFGELFSRWLFFRWVPMIGAGSDIAGEDDPVEDDRPLALRFVDAEGERIDPLARRYAEAACAQGFSFHQILSVEPGQSLHTRDLLTGAEHTVSDQTASRTATRGSIVYACIAELEGVALFVGCGKALLPPRVAYALLDLRDDLAPDGELLSAQNLIDHDDLLRDAYFAIQDDLLHPAPPKLTNTDGDPIEPIRLEYALRCSPGEAFEALASLAVGATREERLGDAEWAPDGTLRAVRFSWSKKGNRQHASWDNTILGAMSIEGDRLRVEVNSRKRAQRIWREIAKRLGERARFERETVESIEAMLEAQGLDTDDAEDGPEAAPPEPPPEIAAQLAEMRRAHWAQWLDDRIPALGGQTPREAARDPKGRERLEALLLEFEHANENPANVLAPDVAALRRALGL